MERRPVLLLDEVAAHLDPARRCALFERLAAGGGQVWMTGTEPALFAELGAACRLHVSAGRVVREGLSPQTPQGNTISPQLFHRINPTDFPFGAHPPQTLPGKKRGAPEIIFGGAAHALIEERQVGK